MAKTFMQMADEARAAVPTISIADTQWRLEEDPRTLVVDVRDAADIDATGLIPGAAAISLGMLAVRADTELPEAYRDPRLQDRARPIITTCGVGLLASLGAKTLKDMGFTDVHILEGGTKGWQAAGLPTEPLGDA